MGAYCIAQGAHLGVLCWPRWMGWMGGRFRREGIYACVQLIHFAVLQKLTEHCKTPISSVQLLSCVRLFTTPWTAAHRASLSITNSRSPPKTMSIESVMPSNHLILCHSFLLLPSIFPSIRVFSIESALCRVAKVLEFQLQHQSFQWTPRIDLL